jgi:hypothetical protein
MLQPTVSLLVCHGVKHPSGAPNQIFITVKQLRICSCGTPSLMRGRVCRLQLLLVSPAQSFSGPSPTGLMIIFYCLRFETLPVWRVTSGIKMTVHGVTTCESPIKGKVQNAAISE